MTRGLEGALAAAHYEIADLTRELQDAQTDKSRMAAAVSALRSQAFTPAERRAGAPCMALEPGVSSQPSAVPIQWSAAQMAGEPCAFHALHNQAVPGDDPSPGVSRPCTLKGCEAQKKLSIGPWRVWAV